MNKAITWTIAGSDSGGGAGIQADLATFRALGTHGCSVITALTAQNSKEVTSIYPVPAQEITAQLEALSSDLPAAAVKLGMLGDHHTLVVVKKFLQHYSGFSVLDPVLISTSGNALFTDEKYASALQMLFPLIDLVTPNIQEAEKILNITVQSHDDMKGAAEKFLALGAKSVLIKGGHFHDDNFSQDYWTNGQDVFWLVGERHLGKIFHGAGCTLSAAIATCVALGYALQDALVVAKMYVHRGIRLAKSVGQGPAPVAHADWPESAVDLPCIVSEPLARLNPVFPECGEKPLGLYPIVDRAEWLNQLLPLGVTTIQLRVKDLKGAALEREIKTAVQIAEQHNARLFINDYWELAIKHGAYGVHLGQEDLFDAEIKKIHAAGLRLGVSTHSYFELARAHALRPSYVALGPIYPTTSKVMRFGPQGLLQLARWRSMVQCPLVAIGGIDAIKLPEVLAMGVDGVAMISAITQAEDPCEMTRNMLAVIKGRHSRRAVFPARSKL